MKAASTALLASLLLLTGCQPSFQTSSERRWHAETRIHSSEAWYKHRGFWGFIRISCSPENARDPDSPANWQVHIRLKSDEGFRDLEGYQDMKTIVRIDNQPHIETTLSGDSCADLRTKNSQDAYVIYQRFRDGHWGWFDVHHHNGTIHQVDFPLGEEYREKALVLLEKCRSPAKET